jgi:type IV pilus assembly protein PilM
MSTTDFFSLEITDNAIKIFDGEILPKEIVTKKISPLDNLPFSFFTQDTPDVSQKLADVIKKLVSDLKIAKRKVNVIIPDAYTYSQILPMPYLNEKELISAIKYQADQFIPLPIDEVNIDLEILYQNEKAKNLLVMVVAAPKKLATKIEELINLSGLIPNVLENQLSSFGRFLTKFSSFLTQKFSQKIVFINLDHNSTSLYFFDPNISLISKVHTFNLGYSLFLKELQINTSFDNKKINELLSSFDPKSKNPVDVETIITPVTKQFVFEIKKILSPDMIFFLIGEVFRFPELATIFSKNINSTSFSIFNPYPLFKPDPQVDHYKNFLSFFVTTFGGQIE